VKGLSPFLLVAAMLLIGGAVAFFVAVTSALHDANQAKQQTCAVLVLMRKDPREVAGAVVLFHEFGCRT